MLLIAILFICFCQIKMFKRNAFEGENVLDYQNSKKLYDI